MYHVVCEKAKLRCLCLGRWMIYRRRLRKGYFAECHLEFVLQGRRFRVSRRVASGHVFEHFQGASSEYEHIFAYELGGDDTIPLGPMVRSSEI